MGGLKSWLLALTYCVDQCWPPGMEFGRVRELTGDRRGNFGEAPLVGKYRNGSLRVEWDSTGLEKALLKGHALGTIWGQLF